MGSKNLLIIAGPTAVGKTKLAIDIAQKYNTVILSADSRQVYKEMEIGTAKPSAKELMQVPHYFVNYKHVWEKYNAGAYERDAVALLDELFKTYDTVILTGGSGLYIQAVTHGFNDLPSIDSNIRQALNDLFKKEGLIPLQEELKEKDPIFYEEVDIQNPVRLIRALEVIRSTGIAYSIFRTKEIKNRSFSILKIALNRDREELYNRINDRMDRMLEMGLEKEVSSLMSYKSENALQTVGYSEVFDFLDGKYDRMEMIRLLKQNSRNYAKRQLTWFRKDKEYAWFHPDDWNGILAYLDEKIVI